ncbi:MAG: HPr-rel-A system PqqD family peptide chaperone [Firmicutes bacterium]|nr:HPr-rel-A system PqqD family peptide chaperone [Bacillota bacterium]
MEKPIKKQNLTLTDADDESILYDSESGQIHVLNQVGARIWDLCNGERTHAEIALFIKDEFETDEKTAASDTDEFISQLRELQLID